MVSMDTRTNKKHFRYNAASSTAISKKSAEVLWCRKTGEKPVADIYCEVGNLRARKAQTFNNAVLA